MKVSQVLHKMDRDEKVMIVDFDNRLDNYIIYEGTVRGIHRDSPLLGKYVSTIVAADDTIVLDVGVMKGKRNNERNYV